MLINILLTVLAIVAFAWACVDYAKSSWHLNDDLMGASMAFTMFWMMGAALLFALLLRVTTLLSSLGAFIAIVVAGKAVEGLVIEPVLHRIFPKYRQDVDRTL